MKSTVRLLFTILTKINSRLELPIIPMNSYLGKFVTLEYNTILRINKIFKGKLI